MKIEVTGYTPNEDSFAITIDGTEFTARLQHGPEANSESEYAISADGVTFVPLRERYGEAEQHLIESEIVGYYEDWHGENA